MKYMKIGNCMTVPAQEKQEYLLYCTDRNPDAFTLKRRDSAASDLTDKQIQEVNDCLDNETPPKSLKIKQTIHWIDMKGQMNSLSATIRDLLPTKRS
jgi:hypothetical protein